MQNQARAFVIGNLVDLEMLTKVLHVMGVSMGFRGKPYKWCAKKKKKKKRQRDAAEQSQAHAPYRKRTKENKPRCYTTEHQHQLQTAGISPLIDLSTELQCSVCQCRRVIFISLKLNSMSCVWFSSSTKPDTKISLPSNAPRIDPHASPGAGGLKKGKMRWSCKESSFARACHKGSIFARAQLSRKEVSPMLKSRRDSAGCSAFCHSFSQANLNPSSFLCRKVSLTCYCFSSWFRSQHTPLSLCVMPTQLDLESMTCDRRRANQTRSPASN